MRFSTLALLSFATSTSSLQIWPRQSGTCPPVWSDIVHELQSSFAGCSNDARGAIRATFHDCINNGCDGSLILTDECSRAENAGLPGICARLHEWSTRYNVSAADMIQFAAATAIAVCPLGPKVRALVGRIDRSNPAAIGSVPSSRDPVNKILGQFSAWGLSSADVVALVGTHSVAIQVHDDPAQAGKALDSTPSTYDTVFYKETKEGTAPYTLQSDREMAKDAQTAGTWSEFGDNQGAWIAKFTDAWNRLAVLGNDVGSLTDCSSLIQSISSRKRSSMKFHS